MNGAAVIQPSPIPFYTVLVLYLGIMAFIGWYAGRKTNSIGDFFVLSGKAGVLVSGIKSLVALVLNLFTLSSSPAAAEVPFMAVSFLVLAV